ncbi:hypothetical protein DPMN_091156 [Dreissena polymorpha]|uniref:Uncharacterized protein n=1 Tax=Dreissena polymorpha TaxID=45954 RepID=A0A9D4QYW4_DREPO|nr:hypothetical protein DPMN_091156 [Dreissena polymorpha]
MQPIASVYSDQFGFVSLLSLHIRTSPGYFCEQLSIEHRVWHGNEQPCDCGLPTSLYPLLPPL